MKTALIFPGSLGKTTEDALARAYQGSTILSCTTSSGDQVGLLFGTGQPCAVIPSPGFPSRSSACAGYLGYPFSNKKRKSHITPLSLATYSSDGEEMELRELSFTHFWNGYPQQHIQEEMAAVALVSPPGWEAALSQVLPALFRRVPLRSDLANSF